MVATPLDDLNIQWTTSTLDSSEEMTKDPLVGGDVMVVHNGGEGVPVTSPIEPSAQLVLTEDGRDVVAPTEEVVVAKEAESGEEESGRAGSDRLRVRPRSGGDVVVAEWGFRGAVGVSGSSGAGDGGDDPKRRRVAIEEPAREQGLVGITLGDYIVHANSEDAAALGREAPGILDVGREEVA